MASNPKYLRRHVNEEDKRSPGQRDRDRILYSPSFRRLAGVTQVVCPLEGHVFHNRLTHTLEVAQIARRLAEYLKDDPLAAKAGGIDPDVVEAAALAHDLGLPPFGHAAENELKAISDEYKLLDGFEGNAQSFRIITKIEVHRDAYDGLDLSRATLNAILKYPWFRNITDEDNLRHKKFGAYHSEEIDFNFAREYSPSCERPSIEASIMDIADDIAYSVHDLDDFFRAGLIPMEYLRYEDSTFNSFIDRWINDNDFKFNSELVKKYKHHFRDFWFSFFTLEKYTGTREQRAKLTSGNSFLIRRFIDSIKLVDKDGEVYLEMQPLVQAEMRFFQRLVWTYVISNPQLATQQHGQRMIIRRLFEIFLKSVIKRDKNMIPPLYHSFIDNLPAPVENNLSNENNRSATPEEIRIAIDIVAGLSDDQANNMFKRFIGVSPGSIMDLINR